MNLTDIVFTAGDAAYTWADVSVYAALRGDWRKLREQARAGLAAEHHVANSGRALSPDVIEAFGRSFRYARNLATATSMREWLDAWGLSVADWTHWLRRHRLREHFAAELPSILASYQIPDDDVRPLTMIEAVCTDTLSLVARNLASFAALVDPGTPTPSKTLSLPDDELAWLPAMPRDLVDESLRRITAAEAAFAAFREATVVESALRSHVSSRALDWTKLDCSVMTFGDVNAANEAIFCLRVDNMPATEVARVSGANHERRQLFLDEIEADDRRTLIGAGAGDIVGPLTRANDVRLYVVNSRTPPALDEPIVRQRAEREVLDAALQLHVANRVRWQVRL